MNYYNEHDPKAAAWLRELICSGEIPPGKVDERSICDVRPDELRRFTQCHFFAGIGGWSYALALAGWPADRPVWTGSCPCQPFSTAGKQLGEKDERHLWPVFRNLIEKCSPPVVFGEQVASPLGRLWLSGVRSDLEALGYAVGAADLCAAGVGAPHIRQRLYWVAQSDSNSIRNNKQNQSCCRPVRRMGRIKQSIPWNESWESALFRLRALDDGLSYGVAGCNGPRNAIVPQVAAEFIKAFTEIT